MKSVIIAMLIAALASPALAQTCPAWSAWAYFTCTGACASGSAPPTVVSGQNVSSMARYAAGTYRINFTTPSSNATSYGCTGSNATASGTGSQMVIGSGQTAASMPFQTIINGGGGFSPTFADPTAYGFIDCRGL